ncbi:unnamed protein product [Phytomonas sp. Hart1]|nr:unnamed protein product [Phytomonas sp. Hart1]|eukprot:CCW67099.1 unnamed protein product [Phytomonas sp. isolate Hart1]
MEQIGDGIVPTMTHCSLNFRELLHDPNLSLFMHAVTRSIIDSSESASLMSRIKPLDSALVYRSALLVPLISKHIDKPSNYATELLNEEDKVQEICRDILNSLSLQGYARELLQECQSCDREPNGSLRFTQPPSLSQIQQIEENYPNYMPFIQRRETQLQLEILSLFPTE